MKKIPVFIKMLLIFVICLSASGIGQYIFGCTQNTLAYYFALFLGYIAIHFLVMFFSAPIVQMVFQKKFDYDSFWFRPKAFEKKLYQILKVKKWKSIVPTYDKREYDLKEEELEQVIHNICHAEVTHEVIMLTGYFPVLLGQQISHWGILLMMSFLFSLVHLPFIFIQRYNRPRVIRLYKKANNHNAKEWTRSI
jgi:hypothetical protein